MKKPYIEDADMLTGIARAMSHVSRFAQEAAESGMSAQELATEIKRREEAVYAWADDVRAYRQYVGRYDNLAKEEQDGKAGSALRVTLERMGEMLSNSRIVKA